MGNGLKYHYAFDPEGDSTAARVTRLAAAAAPGSGPLRVLELGCAAGAMSAVLQGKYGCTVTGVERDPAAAREARRFCRQVQVCDLDEGDWLRELAGERFDAVVAADVLEHLRDPAMCLRALRGVLEADGALVVSVPNIAHAGVVAALLSGHFPYVDTGLLDRTHIHFFTARTLQEQLMAAGFEVVDYESVDAGPWHPEFQAYWQRLPAATREWLQAAPFGRAFQIVVRARPSERPALFPLPPETELDSWLQQGLPGPCAATPEHAAVQRELIEARTALDEARAAQQALLGSTSWQLTAPLRRFARLFKLWQGGSPGDSRR